MRRRAAKEQTSTTRVAYIQSPILIGGYHKIRLADLRDLVAATEDYDEQSQVTLESTSVKVTEHIASGWREVGRDTPDQSVGES